MPVNVINLEGEKEPFSFQKVYQSALRAGADKKTAEEIAEKIKNKAYEGIKTSDIFKEVNSFLSQESPKAALRFNLKQAMKKLGPAGFAFEKYAGEIFAQHGFKIRYNQQVKGLCTEHEIDFVAQNKEEIFFAECKYRNRAGNKIDLPIALQNYARFLDIKKGKEINGREFKTIVITNTKFTSKAAVYSACVKAELLGWRYPRKRGLERLIEEKNLYPVTILPSFEKRLVQVFVQKRIMLAKNVLEINPQTFAQKNDVSLTLLKTLVEEAETLLN